MKTTNIFFLFLLVSISITAQNYHFQEGFATANPEGWTRLCSATTSLNHGDFTGNYAMQFKPQDDYNGIDKYLESPAVNKAGTLTFYAVKNANAVYYDINVAKIVDGVSTLLETIPSADISHKNNGWTKITITINDPSDNIKIRVWSTGTSDSYVALDDFSLTSDIDTKFTVTGTSIAAGEVCFYNLTKEIMVSYNQEIVAGAGKVLLNGEEISLSSAIIEGQKVTIPLSLTSDKAANKAQVIKIEKNAFVTKHGSSELETDYILNFETFRKANVPDNYGEIIDIQYSDASEAMCRMDFYYPTNAVKPTPVLINMHGGGWNHGYKEEQTSFNPYTRTELGFAVANIEYRMTPQATAPAAVEDVRCAMQYLLENAESLNIDPRKIVFQGASSGAHLALVAGYLQNDRKYDTGCNNYEGEIKILAVINKYGPSELWELRNNALASSVRNWLGSLQDDEDFVKSVSPVHMVNANVPPTYTVHGTSDFVVPKSVSSDILVPKLQEFGVTHVYKIISGGGHGGFTSAQNQEIYTEITNFLNPLIQAVDLITSLEDNFLKGSEMKIWNQGSLIYSSVPGKLNIFSTTGTKIAAMDIENSINLSLEKGIYIAELNTANGEKYVRKLYNY